ncbi:uncharacterized protein LOC111130348 isoform X2 [Crassostrea virginica]|nr:probable splicing factor, arginine/serine-rich 6 isoform X2 [Crassostrea virginica]
MPTKIFIGNLGSNCRSEDLRELFEKYGKVTECDVLKNFGFVHMQSEEEADDAIKNLDGFTIKGNRMRVELSTGKSRGGGRGGGRMRGGGRGGGRGSDRGYGPPARDRYDPYRRPPAYDDYYRYPPRDDRRGPPPERYDPPPRDRYYGYERRPPPPEYERYERPRTAASDPYYRERAAIGSRPPPDYYSRSYPDPRGEGPPPPPRSYDDDYSANGYYDSYKEPPPPAPPADSLGSGSYYDRFYKKAPPSQPTSRPPPPPGTNQAEPLYF